MRDEIISANPLERFLKERGYDLRPAGRNYVTNGCAVVQHKKHHRPVTIDTEKNLWHCNDHDCGGTVIDWVMIEENVTAAEAMRILSGGNNGSFKIVAMYDYTDETGKLLFQCVRYQPKDFRQRQPDGKGGWIWGIQGVRRALYRLPQLLHGLKRGLPVIVTEGEKDADRLAKLGFPAAATCNPLGAGKWRDDYSDTLRGATVFVIADKDKEGRKHAHQVAASLQGKAMRLAVLELPDRNGQNVKDASDWLAAGGTTGELAELLDAAPEWTRQTQTGAVGLAGVLDSICDFLRRYVVFSSVSQPVVIALWVAHTWTLDSWDCTPYLHINSPEKRSGKTRLLDLLELLVKEVWRAISPSESVLYRKIQNDQPTLLLDEVDTIFLGNKDERKEPLRALLNAGFERKAKVPRCVGQGSSYRVQEFAVFCAKAFAGIGKLPDTIRDRSISIRLNRRSSEEKIERFRQRDAENAARVIREHLARWAQEPGQDETLRGARPEIPNELDDRQGDICEPLLAIADAAGGDWPQHCRESLITLCSTETNDDDSPGVNLLSAIRDVFKAANSDRLSTQHLLEHLIAQESDAPWADWWERSLKDGNTRGPAAKLARLMKPFGIRARVIRLPDGSTPRGYLRQDFEEAWKRYCLPKPD